MTREELIAYDRWLTENKWGSSEIITPEQAADLYLAKHPLPPAEGAEQRIRVRNILQDFYRRGEYELEQAEEDIMRLFQPQPTAEGAEEILRKNCNTCYSRSTGEEEVWSSVSSVLIAMQDFATLHAQRIAEKMVSERLRGKYVFTYEELRKVCCDFFRSWWNTPGSNTDQGFDAWALKTGLKK